MISSLKPSSAILLPIQSNVYYNEHNRQALLFSCKTYKFGASGTESCLLYVFIRPGGTSKGPFLTHQKI